MDLGVLEIRWGDPLFQQCVDVRMEVFVVEQGVPSEEELDEHDRTATHLALSRDGRIVATCRLRVAEPFLKLERVCVYKSERGHGLGVQLNDAAVKYCTRHHPSLLLGAHAQCSVLPFYTRLGWLVVSEEFLDEVHIWHRSIILPPSRSLHWPVSISIAPHSHLPGELFDPVTLANVHTVLQQIESLSFVPLVSALSLLDRERLGGVLVNGLREQAEAVQAMQKGGGVSFDREVSSVDDEKLTGLVQAGWDALNTGHYSEVAEHWRVFYSLACYVKAAREWRRGEDKTALCLLDRGLMMGRQPGRLLSDLAHHIHENMDKERVEWQPCPALPPPSSLPLSHPIPIRCVSDLPEEEFYSDYVLPGKPVIIRGACKQWKAVEQWSMSSLSTRLFHRTVPVEAGSQYTDEEWGQRLMTGGEFFQHKGVSPSGPLYLAQHRLFEQVPELKEDVDVPEYCTFSCDASDVDLNIWIGPGGTVSPLHTDPRENLFCQVAGCKFFRLVDPKHAEAVYAIDDGILTNTSQVDAACPSPSAHPLFLSVRVWDGVVESGDALFIPKGWWHYVKGLQESVSVSCWFDIGGTEEHEP